jgi:hypothetical protein
MLDSTPKQAIPVISAAMFANGVKGTIEANSVATKRKLNLGDDGRHPVRFRAPERARSLHRRRGARRQVLPQLNYVV